MAVPFLDKIPAFAASFPNATLRVQFAPNSYLPDSTGWVWIDITNDVLQADNRRIQISPMGKSDAAQQVQPSGCAFTLDNSSGNYSKGPQSVYYPNLTPNIPVRVQVALNGVSYTTRFQGYIYSMRPEWDSTGNYAIVEVQAAGITRRLQHGVPALESPLYRQYSRDADVVAYWPMEDADTASRFSQAANYGTNMTYGGTIELANYSGITGSASLPTYTSTGSINAYVNYTFSSNWEVEFLVYMPSAPAADTAVLRIHTGGSQVIRWEIVWKAGSSTDVSVVGYNDAATIVVNDNATYFGTVGLPVSVRFMAKQNGTATDYNCVIFPADFSTAGAQNTGSVASTTVGNVKQISNLAAAGMANASLGHIAVIDDYNHTFPDEALIGWGLSNNVVTYVETPYGRLSRLTTEESVNFVAESTSGTEYMGTQGQKSLTSLLRAAEEVDQGILWDGYGPGLHWKSLQDIIGQTATLTLATTDMVAPFGPEDDDQEIVNRVTVSRDGGGSATYEDATGTLGTGTIGIYESSLSGLNVVSDDRLRDFASWLVHQGTVEGYRFPQLSIDLRRIPSKASSWLACDPGSRITIQSIENWVTQLPNGDIDLLMLGYSEYLGRFEWSVTMNCAPWTPYEVPVLDNTSDTYDAVAGWLDTDGHTVNTTALAGATSLSVATASGNPLWSTNSLDVPVYINVGGYRVQLTAVSGTSSPQTFTVSALPATAGAGDSVSIWYPDYLGL